MVTRNSTSIFILMRDNAVRHRSFYSDNRVGDDKPLISRRDSHDTESGSGPGAQGTAVPEVVHSYEEMQYDFDRIRAKMRELAQMHDKHLNRPSLDDTVEEEQRIQDATKQLTDAFGRCHRKLKALEGQRSASGSQFGCNIQQALARTLQDMSSEFRASQSGYLRRLKSREDRSASSGLSTAAAAAAAASSSGGGSGGLSGADDDGLSEFIDRGFALQLVEDNTALVQQREQEINSVLRSIQELGEIFTDVARLVVDQGEVIDRIDYNLDQVETRVHEGLQQLKKAEKYQKKNRKMLIILILAALVVFFTILLVFTKFKR